jgi:hypothetical protein
MLLELTFERSFMNMLLFPGSGHSLGGVRRWTALVAALSMSCLPIPSALASSHSGGGHGTSSGGSSNHGGSHGTKGRSPSSGSGRTSSSCHHANLYGRNGGSSLPLSHHETAFNQHTNKGSLNRSAIAVNHSLTASSARSLMGQRLNQVSSGHWTEHGNFSANHFDPAHGCWFNHGGSWWRGNFWGANWYCNHLIGLGWAPGLCSG